MRNGLGFLAAVVGVAALVAWLATGAHPGWTRTQVTVMQVDPITELEYPVTDDKFVAGLEVLGGGILFSIALLGASFAFKKQPTKN